MVAFRTAHQLHRPPPHRRRGAPGPRARPAAGRPEHRAHPRQPDDPGPPHRRTGRAPRPRVTPELREWDYGGYEGITTPAIRRTRPFWNLWTDGVDPGSDEHPGESPEQIGQRADQVLAGVRSAADGIGSADIALVAHSHFLRVLTARYLGLTPAEGRLFQLATGALSRLGTEHGRPVVAALNVALPESLQPH